MISVLIPTYNYTCYKLVKDLHEQLERSEVKYEIVVAEDGSRDQVAIIANHKIGELSNCRHVASGVYNVLIAMAEGESGCVTKIAVVR